MPFLIPFIGASMQRLFISTAVLPLDGSVNTSGFVIYDNGDGETPVDILLDLGLEKVSPSKQSSNHRVGTAPFMARDVLNLSKNELTRGLHHDLESGHIIPKKGDILAEWRKGYWSDILVTKRDFISDQKTMKSILDHIENPLFRARCRAIGDQFFIAAGDGLSLQVQQTRLRRSDQSLQEALATEIEGTTKGNNTSAPVVTYAEWMKAAFENPSLRNEQLSEGCRYLLTDGYLYYFIRVLQLGQHYIKYKGCGFTAVLKPKRILNLRLRLEDLTISPRVISKGPDKTAVQPLSASQWGSLLSELVQVHGIQRTWLNYHLD
ncbi:hypothetical protein DFH11DRAFT_1807262 [Phellopilus nigrolimitatus]|nr:hypothetical protein DFH11DRAFT_1807262 [Phellopilus nigrolimitatus]